MVLRRGNEVFVVSAIDIVFLAARGFYTEVYFEYSGMTERLIVCKPISVFCSEIECAELLRVHRSFAVHSARIEAIVQLGRNFSVHIGSHIIPVARSKAALVQALPSFSQ